MIKAKNIEFNDIKRLLFWGKSLFLQYRIYLKCKIKKLKNCQPYLLKTV